MQAAAKDLDQLRKSRFRHSGFRRFKGEVHLDEYRQAFAAFIAADAFEALGEFDGVDGVYEIEELNGFAGFVGLEVPDEVPFGIAAADLGDLPFRLLHLILTENAHARRDRLAERFGRVRLTDGYELYLVFTTIRPRGRGGYPTADIVEIF